MFATGLNEIANVLVCHPQTAFRALQRGKVPGAEQLANGRWRLDVDAYRAWLLAPRPKSRTQIKREAVAARQAAREAARAERETAIEEPDAPDPFHRRDDGLPTPAEIERNRSFLAALHAESLEFIRSTKGD